MNTMNTHWEDLNSPSLSQYSEPDEDPKIRQLNNEVDETKKVLLVPVLNMKELFKTFGYRQLSEVILRHNFSWLDCMTAPVCGNPLAQYFLNLGMKEHPNRVMFRRKYIWLLC